MWGNLPLPCLQNAPTVITCQRQKKREYKLPSLSYSLVSVFSVIFPRTLQVYPLMYFLG